MKVKRYIHDFELNLHMTFVFFISLLQNANSTKKLTDLTHKIRECILHYQCVSVVQARRHEVVVVVCHPSFSLFPRDCRTEVKLGDHGASNSSQL